MRFIKNYSTWLKPHILDTILSVPGDRRPETDNVGSYKIPLYDKARAAGYSIDKIGWTLYYQSHFQNKIEMPFDPGEDGQWWFSKLNPGDMFPMHQDLFKENKPNIRRFWMAMQDAKLGHVFVYENTTLGNYQAGDLFEFEDSNAWHAACNLGFEAKVSLQIVSYSDSIIF
jgi:hypothetical protein